MASGATEGGIQICAIPGKVIHKFVTPLTGWTYYHRWHITAARWYIAAFTPHVTTISYRYDLLNLFEDLRTQRTKIAIWDILSVSQMVQAQKWNASLIITNNVCLTLDHVPLTNWCLVQVDLAQATYQEQGHSSKIITPWTLKQRLVATVLYYMMIVPMVRYKIWSHRHVIRQCDRLQ